MGSREIRLWTAVAVLLLGGGLAATWWALGRPAGTPASATGRAPAAVERTPSQEDAGSRSRADAREAPVAEPAAASIRATADGVHPAPRSGVTIEVVSAADGAPIAGAEVVLDGREPAITAADGRAALPAGPLEDPSGLDLRVSAAGFVTWRGLFPPDVRALRLELFRGVQLQVTVLLPDGRPFPDVLVSSFQRAGDQNVTRYAPTDAQGVAALRDVAPGVPLRLRVGQGMQRHHGEELVVHGDATHVIRIEQQGAIAGLLRDADGRPAEGRRIQVESELGRRVFARTDAAGAFHLDGLDVPGAFRILCVEPELRARGSVYLTPEEPEGRVELQLAPPPYRLEVLVREAGGAPLPNLTVAARPVDQDATPAWLQPLGGGGSASTDREGRCLLLPAAAGEYELEVWHGASSTKRRAHVAEGVTATVEFALEGTAELVVRVLDDRGQPQMASVRFLPGGRADIPVPLHVESERGLGVFVARGLPAEAGIVTVSNQRTAERGAAIWLTRIPGCVPGDEPIEVRLDAPGRLVAQLAAPPEDDWISWSARSGELSRNAGTPLLSEGRIEMYVGCPGAFDLCVQPPGGKLHVLRGLTVSPGETLDLGTLGSGQLFELRGTVLGPSGELVAGAEVEFSTPGFANELTTSTDARGNFVLERVPELDGALRARADGYVDARLEVRGGATESVVLRLDSSARLEGRVHAAGEPLRGRPYVSVSELLPEGPSNGGSTTQAGSDGAFDLELDPGRYRVYVLPFDRGEVRATADVVLRAGETTRLDLDVAR